MSTNMMTVRYTCGRCHHVWSINWYDERISIANRRVGASDRRRNSRTDRRKSQ